MCDVNEARWQVPCDAIWEGEVLGGGKMILVCISATIGDASAYLLVARRADLGAVVIAEQKSSFLSFVVNDDQIVRRDDRLANNAFNVGQLGTMI